ncbi:MAG: gliding motility-associated C-terminal domain-containing protein [Chitinophagaceae bacterium]|nr:gliding motility-associated C-terminal domain-containing protein [Chitinophagaceae bacterium]
MKRLFLIIGLLGLLLSSRLAQASHIFGGELYYTHMGGLNYEITLTLYGDCSGSSFPNLPNSVPKIGVYNGNNASQAIYLYPINGTGDEVTPVCPAEINNTTCKGGSIPGVARYIYTGIVTLNGTSANWRFVFDGDMGQGNGAGRSNAITNINQPGNATMIGLEATLNNVNGPNNSSTFTSIPTPFFCINFPQQYNQGAIDADGDQLNFSLIPALDGAAGNVNYISPYTYDQPLATTPGSFIFNTSTGQMNFQPNQVQNSVVVNQVMEYRNGILVGSSMREMTIVVLNNCNNQSPNGSIAGSNIGNVINPNEISICNSGSTLTFDIQVSDPDGQAVFAFVNGLPVGAYSTITGNNTLNPSISITWPVPPGTPMGSYTFYVTYQDDGCPLSSKQTVAYTIHLEQPIVSAPITDPESCIPGQDGAIILNASSPNGVVSSSLNGAAFQQVNSYNGLSSGNYVLTLMDPAGCTDTLQINLGHAVVPDITQTIIDDISCYGLNDGRIQLVVEPADTAYSYTLYPGALANSNGLFQSLSENNYTIIVSDQKGCADTTSASITEPLPLLFTEITTEPLSCNKQNGRIFAKSNYTDSVKYVLTPGLKISSAGLFENLFEGMYTLTLHNENGCEIDTTLYIGVKPPDFFISTTHEDLRCLGKGYEGSAQVYTQGGIPPFTYLWSSQPPQTDPIANNLYYGDYVISVTDASGCEVKDTVTILPGNCCEQIYIPNAFTPNGDGVNDEWKITTSTGMNIKQFAVFNRWGEMVWKGHDQRHFWDGTHKGEAATLGTYFYLLRYQCLSDGQTYTLKGDIHLLR